MCPFLSPNFDRPSPLFSQVNSSFPAQSEILELLLNSSLFILVRLRFKVDISFSPLLSWKEAFHFFFSPMHVLVGFLSFSDDFTFLFDIEYAFPLALSPLSRIHSVCVVPVGIYIFLPSFFLLINRSPVPRLFPGTTERFSQLVSKALTDQAFLLSVTYLSNPIPFSPVPAVFSPSVRRAFLSTRHSFFQIQRASAGFSLLFF